MFQYVQALAICVVVSFTLSCQSKSSKKRDSESGNAYIEPVPQYQPQYIPPQQNYQTPAPQQQQSPCYKADEFMCAVELAILEKTNEYRRTKSKPDLKLSPKISFSARLWSDEQASRGRIGHGGFPRQRRSDLMQEFQSISGLSLTRENVAMTQSRSQDADAIATRIVDMWIKSWGHRRNMLANSSHIGIGVSQKNGRSFYATQIFGGDTTAPDLPYQMPYNPNQRNGYPSPYTPQQQYGVTN